MKISLHGVKMQILLHIVAWITIFGLPFYYSYRLDIPTEFIWGFYINAIINGFIFYGNYLLLIPKLFLKNRKITYYLSAILLAAAMFIFSFVINDVVHQMVERRYPDLRYRREAAVNRENPPTSAVNRENPPTSAVNRENPPARRPASRGFFFRIRYGGPMYIYNFAFNALVFTIFALGLRVLGRHADIEKRQKELEKEKLNSELAFLKNQISPHFFFNTLNNIYSLIGINANDSQEAVLKLSKMMRYLLYESEQGETRLSSEIDFMNNYIDLMKLRISDKVKLDISFPEEYDNITIPPLLFISIIENAFKHGISYRDKSFIKISMDMSGKLITFKCSNSMLKNLKQLTSSDSGIGLENLKKRLNLLFPEKHELTINKTDFSFDVLVKISIK